ncbi:MAG: uroporphyrinogen decarboxylase family protein [Desulfobacterales bacterium]
MNAGYTGKDRIKAALRGDRLDRIPINIHVPNAHELAGFTIEECVIEPDNALTAQIKAHELFPSDMVNVPGDPFLPANAAVLAKVRFGPNAMPTYPVADKSSLNQIEVRDPRQSKLYGKYLEMCYKTQERFKEQWVSALLAAPWSVAANGLRGIENLIYDTADDPQFVHDILKKGSELSKARGDALLETGVTLMLAETSASCSVISPRIYKDYVQPYLVDVIDHFKRKNAVIDLHICGYTNPILDEIASLDVDIIDIDGPTSLNKTLELCGQRMCIRGNLAAELFQEGTPEQLEAAVKECLAIASGSGKYILSPGCTIPENSPMENIRAFWEAGIRYGRCA